ncbi:MAG: Fic family protein [Candidatus Moraniibacteriota bacterium]|nr:MAG: Fic family protein [Candidatus Moranbacteria bacterium]
MENKASFEARFTTLPGEIWSKIAKIDEIKGRWTGGLKLSPQVLMRLKKSILVTSSGASTRIEGSKLSDEEVEAFIQGVKPGKWESRDEQEVRGYYELLSNVFDAWRTLSFSESSIKHFHKELLKYVEKDERHRGEYKKGENTVKMFDADGKEIGEVFETTPAYLTPKKMQELVSFTLTALEEKHIHSLLVIGNFIVEFLRIHPFQDGNGRLSRVLTNLLLLKKNYAYAPYVSHEKLIEDNKENYYIALRRSQKSFGTEKEDITPWLDFFLTMLLKQSEMALELMESEQVEKLLSPKQLAVWEYVQGVAEATPSEIAQGTGVARPTVNQALTKLLKVERIEKIGSGRSTRYRKL